MRNIKLFWWSLRELENLDKENFGDLLSKYLVEKISSKKTKWILFGSSLKHYFVIGSILKYANHKTSVWGSGIIDREDLVSNANFIAVRGPRTYNRLIELGHNVPKVFGDPAILISDYYKVKTKSKKIYKYGIIPHYVDYKEVILKFDSLINVKVINLLNNDIEEVLDSILECEFILSSSLHGIIIAHSYFIPALWVKFSNNLSGDNVKFHDYYESLDIIFENEIEFIKKDCTLKDIDEVFILNKDVLVPKKEKVKEMKKNLLEVCPFTKTIFYK
jgi:hypothetical protein